jgi:APA family basic amino acid/polyamine antiporter
VSVEAPSASGELARGLNLWDTSLLVLGLVIGGGIFLTPASIAKSLPASRWILAVWVLGGLISLAGGLVYAEMGAMLPKAGGMYVYVREAFGALPAFLYAWVAYWVILAGAGAAVAIGFAEYLAVFFPGLSNGREVFALGSVTVTAGQIVAVVATLALSATHYVGIREGARIQGAFTSLIVLALIWLAVGGALAPRPAAAPQVSPSVTAAAVGTAMVAVFWTYYGWNEIVAAAGEVANPKRTLPLALLIGTVLVMFLYVSVNAVFLKAMSATELASTAQPAALAAQRLFGTGTKALIALAITAAAFGCTSAGLVPGPRIVYALARDGLFPRAFGRVHARFRTPSVAIAVQAVWISLLCLSGRYDQLYTYATFAVILAYAATGISLFRFRRTRPDIPRPYRCWGYPAVPLFFVACSVFLAVNTVREQPRESLAGVAILLLGVPVYAYMRRRLPEGP